MQTTHRHEADLDDVIADLPPLLSRAQLAALLGIAQRTVTSYVSDGRITGIRITGRGGPLRFTRSEVRRFLAAQQTSEHGW